MKKNISTFGVALMLLAARMGLQGALDEVWGKLPEDPNGPEVDKEDFDKIAGGLFDEGVRRIEALIGELPIVGEDDLAPVDPEEPGDGQDGDWTTLPWGGDQSLDFKVDGNRDRRWWTKIHGEEVYVDWSRKFPLPKDVESASRLQFEFSDGTSLVVPNPRTMSMKPNGPKYLPENPGEWDPRKKHPKVGAVPGSRVTWVKYRKG